MTAQNRFYRPIFEADTQAGYADIFLCPLLDIYPDMQHSYIIELKYAKYKDPEDRVEELRKEGTSKPIGMQIPIRCRIPWAAHSYTRLLWCIKEWK